MPLRGNLDAVTHRRVDGWAWDADRPGEPVSLILACDGQVIARVLADQHRPDLELAGIGDGRHSFSVELPIALSPLARHIVTVRREEDGHHLHPSPVVLEPAAAFDHPTQQAIARLLSTYDGPGDLEQRLLFLVDQADRLRQIHAEAQSGAAEAESRRRGTWSEPGPIASSAPASSGRPRALVIDERMPLAGHDAGSNALLSHMRALQRLGYDVTFVPATLQGDGAHLAAEGITCCLHPWYATVEEVLRRQRNRFALVYLHRIATAGAYTALAREHQPQARLIYSVADLHHLRLARQAEVERRPELARWGERMRLAELTAAWQADVVITHSTAEAAILRRHMPAEKVHVVPWDLAPRPTPALFAERSGFAFIGSYAYRPNVDAAHWLVDQVMPKLEAQGGGVPCVLVGSDMPDSLRALQRDDVDPVGRVDDLASVFGRVRLTVAPLAYGAGVKGKVLDSLAAGVPCVCTPIAAEGIDLPEILRELVCSTPDELARAILRLHADAELNRACGEAGLAYIADAASEARVDERLAEAVGRHRGG